MAGSVERGLNLERLLLAQRLAALRGTAREQLRAALCQRREEAAGAGDSRAASAAEGLHQLGRQLGCNKAFSALELKQAEKAVARGIQVCALGEADYPGGFYSLGSPPLLLWYRGRSPSAFPSADNLAIVGSRDMKTYAEGIIRKVVETAARHHLNIVSGLAFGCDACAARRAILEEIPTLAFLPLGLDSCYPGQHESLAAEIVAAGGCLMSELPLGTRVKRSTFAARNRLIAAMSKAVFIPQAGLGSGSLLTAGFAFELARSVYTVPAAITWREFDGNHQLLKEGAQLITSMPEMEAMCLETLFEFDALSAGTRVTLNNDDFDLLFYISVYNPDFTALTARFARPAQAMAQHLEDLRCKELIVWRGGLLHLTLLGFACLNARR